MTDKRVTIELSEEAALELYNWLESDASPNYWEAKGLVNYR